MKNTSKGLTSSRVPGRRRSSGRPAKHPEFEILARVEAVRNLGCRLFERTIVRSASAFRAARRDLSEGAVDGKSFARRLRQLPAELCTTQESYRRYQSWSYPGCCGRPVDEAESWARKKQREGSRPSVANDDDMDRSRTHSRLPVSQKDDLEDELRRGIRMVQAARTFTTRSRDTGADSDQTLHEGPEHVERRDGHSGIPGPARRSSKEST